MTPFDCRFFLYFSVHYKATQTAELYREQSNEEESVEVVYSRCDTTRSINSRSAQYRTSLIQIGKQTIKFSISVVKFDLKVAADNRPRRVLDALVDSINISTVTLASL